MKILQGVVVLILFSWFVVTTFAVLSMPPMEYGWQAWAIVALGPVAVVAGLWEICARVFGGQRK